jgi:hypothetical protein
VNGNVDTVIDQFPRASRRGYKAVLVAMAMASFLLYVLGVLALRQDRAPGWSLEASGSLPAAVSYLVYGTPLGAVDDNVNKRFLNPDGASVQTLLAAAAAGSIPRGAVVGYSLDATGVGTNLFATAAMALFGIALSSLVKLYLMFVGVSVVAFVLRFQDRRLLVLPLYFLAVTVMLAAPLGSEAAAIDQVPVGGQRYFVIAAILPALHIFFAIIDRSGATTRGRKIANWLLLFVQAALLFAALLVRSSAGYLLVAPLAVLLWQIWRGRKQRGALTALAGKAAAIGAALVLWAIFVVNVLPAYVHTGRTFGNVWHRAFVSFAAHPQWPFGNLRQVYDCTRYIPEGLNQQQPDRNGHCVWWAYPPNQTRPANEVMAGVYSGEYEAVMRNAVFYVATHYPRQTFELYAYIKTGFIRDVLVAAWHDLFDLAHGPVTKAVRGIVAMQGLLFVGFVLLLAAIDRSIVDRRLAIVPVFFAASLAPLYVAWANYWTSADTVALFYCCLALAALLAAQLIMTALSPRSAEPALARRDPD